MTNIQKVLEERGKTHGNFTDNSNTSQIIKAHIRSYPKFKGMRVEQMEALDMIAHKIGRIMAGNHNEVDHWQDICGYAQLVVNILENKE